MALIHIEVRNWSAYNERVDRPNYTWLKFSNCYFADRKLRTISFGARISYIYILCERSKSNKQFAELNTEIAAFELQTTEDAFINHVEELCGIAVIARPSAEDVAASCRRDDGVTPASSRLDKIRLDKIRLDKIRLDKIRKEKIKKETSEPPLEAGFDFVSIAKKYPTSKGRSVGIKRLAGIVKTPETFEAFCRAVENYAEQCRIDGTANGFVKHFSSFVGSNLSGHPWEDWVSVTPLRTRQPGTLKPILSERQEDLDSKVFGGAVNVGG